MLKKTITYTDYNGIKRTEDHYFNLTKSEILKMEMGVTGGLAEMIQTIIKKQDVPQVMKVFENFITAAYGEKSADGRRFIKNKEITEAFMQTEAYDQLYMELVTEADAAAKFFNALIPAELAEEVAKQQKNGTLSLAE